jgi:hypothetical protein
MESYTKAVKNIYDNPAIFNIADSAKPELEKVMQELNNWQATGEGKMDQEYVSALTKKLQEITKNHKVK